MTLSKVVGDLQLGDTKGHLESPGDDTLPADSPGKLPSFGDRLSNGHLLKLNLGPPKSFKQALDVDQLEHVSKD